MRSNTLSPMCTTRRITLSWCDIQSGWWWPLVSPVYWSSCSPGFWDFATLLNLRLPERFFTSHGRCTSGSRALILVSQISILRHPSLRPQLTATLIVTVFSVIFLGVLYYNPTWISDLTSLLQNLFTRIFGVHLFLSSSWTYTVINFLIIGIFWIDTIRRWIRVLRKQSPTRRIDLTTGEMTYAANKDEIPSMSELVSGDLLAGAFLTLILALVLRQEVISFFLHTLQVVTAHPITICTVSLPGYCTVPPTAGILNPPTLTFIDLIQALIYLTIGLLILALYATLQGLSILNPIPGASSSRNVIPADAIRTEESSAVNVGGQVSIAILDTLRSALNRRIYVALDSLAGSLRTVVWPCLIFLGVVAVAASARYIQQYLHLQSDERTCSTSQCPDYGAVQRLISEHVQFVAPVSALLWGIVAVLAIVFSAALLIYRWRVAENSLRLLGLVGLTVLLTFWIFSLALSGFNALFSLTGISQRVPFPQPGVSTIISLVALLIFGTYSLARTMRNRRGAPSGAPVGAASEKGDSGRP